ncbi:hypothetical protein BDN70DRAFT_571628 [Pholiota conissans]|uniref:Uncharacterized protein n=1 Tax=Pholiota conissans TaxID=109636 RepID=A0A9P6CLQ4_9AGAR|nr:hypothetical protein BDN70DRAFT_571628 [Pholiota conissans]
MYSTHVRTHSGRTVMGIPSILKNPRSSPAISHGHSLVHLPCPCPRPRPSVYTRTCRPSLPPSFYASSFELDLAQAHHGFARSLSFFQISSSISSRPSILRSFVRLLIYSSSSGVVVRCLAAISSCVCCVYIIVILDYWLLLLVLVLAAQYTVTLPSLLLRARAPNPRPKPFAFAYVHSFTNITIVGDTSQSPGPEGLKVPEYPSMGGGTWAGANLGVRTAFSRSSF